MRFCFYAMIYLVWNSHIEQVAMLIGAMEEH
jgi:hypothetical protein